MTGADSTQGPARVRAAEPAENGQADELRARLAAIVHTSVDAIVSKDLNGVITSWNDAAERIFGYSAAEAIGQPIMIIIPDDRRAEERRIMDEIHRGARIEAFDTIRRRKDGRQIDVSVAISPIVDSSGRIIGASKIARDITDRKLIQEALATADRRKDEFLATLAHELRNPLAPIRMGLEVMKRVDPSSPSAAQTLAMLDRQLRQLVRLVDELMDVSRINSGRMELHREPIALGTVLHGALESCRPQLDKMNHEFSFVPCSEPLIVYADETRLAQVFINLLHNAAKYTPPGGLVQLTVEKQGAQAVVSVRDTGVGISAEALPHIFDMFTQAHGSAKLGQGGLGIGLCLVKRLLALHGGTVEARSEGEDSGSEFIVRLPLREPVPGRSAS